MSNPHAPLSRTKTAVHGEIQRPEPRTEEEVKVASKFRMVEALIFSAALFGFEIFLIVIYAVWFKYPTDEEALEEFDFLYNLFRDVNIMIFFGFGFLMTFLRRYGYSAVGYTLLISAGGCEPRIADGCPRSTPRGGRVSRLPPTQASPFGYLLKPTSDPLLGSTAEVHRSQD